MRIFNYTKFLESFSIDNILESMSIIEKDLISSISGEELDLFETFKLVKEDYINKNLNYLSENVEFINSLSSLGLKKSAVQDTDDIETFLNISLKFMFIYNIESNELENPVYLILEMWDEDKMEWTNVKLFKVNGDVKRFYDVLSSKTIELFYKDKNYIYKTSNTNDWELQNLLDETKMFKRFLNNVELIDLMKNSGVSSKIV
tara:strand:- start:6273 stop:6881 length:609 start_codon:yes stop_codon:yes gene_type:complete